MDYVRLKQAIATTGLADPAAIVAALNASTVQTTLRVPFADARAVLYNTAELGALRVAYEDASTPKQLKAVLWTALDAFGSDRSIQADDDPAWQSAMRMLAGLHVASLVSQASIDAIAALRTGTVLAWPQGVDFGQVQTALEQST